ncbi:MAG: tetratricopeptide repeat protein, partial [Planctomycetes bacterium]|nr:tetratricopeptide repeat protein [Planctomycetota bacterium]
MAEPASLEAVRQALRERTYSQAEKLARARLRAHPNEVEVRYLNALALFHQAKLAEAEAEAQRLIVLKPDSRWVHKARFLAAECQIRQRSFPGAVKILRAEAARLLSAERKREVCGVILRFADALARIPDPNDPSELDKPRPDYRKAYALYGKALGLEIDEVQRGEVLFKQAKAAERIQPYLAVNHYLQYLKTFDPTWGDAPGRERRTVGAQRWSARERLIRAALASGQTRQAVEYCDDLLRLLGNPAGKGAPASLAATTAWLQLRAYRLPRPSATDLPAALRAIEAFLTEHPKDPGCVAAAYWRAEALAVHGRHDKAIASFSDFLAGKSFASPTGPAAEKTLDGLKATPRELHQRWTQLAVFRIAAIRGQQTRYDQAIKRYQEYTRRFPNGPQWAAAHGAIREAQFQLCLEAVGAKRYDDARKRFDLFLAAHPLDSRAARVLFLLGQLRVAEGEALVKAKNTPGSEQRFKQAIAAWARLASKYPHSNEASLALYQTGLLQEERFDELEAALKTYRRVQRGAAASKARARIALLTREFLRVTSPRVFRTNEVAVVEVETRNLKTLSVRQYFLDLEGYFRKHHEIGGVERLDIGLIQPDATFEVAIDKFRKYAPRKQSVKVPFPKGKGGVCLVSVTGGDYEATTLVVRSDLEIMFRASREELLAFAQNARLGKPAAGVKVLLSDGEKLFVSGTTGKDGVWRLKHERLRRAGKLQLFAHQGGMVAASGLSLRGLSSGLKLAERGYLYCDRPAYQPGQVVHVKGIVRAAGSQGYEVPATKSYRVRLIGPRGKVLDEEVAPLTRFGTFCASFILDTAVPVGGYRVMASPTESKKGPSASGTFTVQQFELRPIELTLVAPRKVYRRGEVVELKAKARFSWGQPLVGKRVEVRLPNGRTTQLKTDDQGICTVSFDTSGRPAGQPLHFRATLVEEGVSAGLTVFMPRLGFSVGVRLSQPLVLAGEPVEVQVSTHGPDGKPVGRKIVLFVQRRQVPVPDPVLAKVPWFGQRQRAAAALTIQEHSLQTDPKTGLARISVELPEGGDYVLRAVGEDRFKQQVVSEGRVKVSGAEDATRLRIFSKQATLKVGRRHKARLHSRLKKSTLALLTYEGDAVLEYRILNLKAGFTDVETGVDHLHFPNFRLAVTALEEQVLHTAHKDFRVERELKVQVKPSKARQAPGSKSTVEILVTDQLGRPVQAELSLALVEETLYARYPETTEPIRDAFEKGVTRKAEFRVAASNGFRYQAKTTKILQAFKDEANRLDDLSKEKSELKNLELSMADESEAMQGFAGGKSAGRRGRMRRSPAKKRSFAPRPMNAPGAPRDSRAESDDMDESRGASAGEAAPAPRKDELGGGFWKCQITTDAQGRATIQVPLPERATRWRFTARGVTVSTLVGQARSEVITAKDFFCELLAPRHLRAGDRPRLLARVHGKAGQKVQLGLDIRQGKRTLISTRRDSIVLGPGGTSEILLPEIEVPTSDALTFVLRASSGEAHDSVAKDVDVLPWGEELVAHGGGTAEGGASVALRLPRGELRSRWLTVMVGPSLDDTLAELALNSGRGWPSSLGGRLLGLSSALRYARKTGADRATLARLE